MKRVCAILIPLALSALPGCDRRAADAPPVVRLGHSVCEQCNMIISDERWATATIIKGPRGPEAQLFDDFNCQVNYEVAHPDATVLARWSRSYATGEWIRTGDAHFLMSPELRTPMGSQMAAFASQSEAESAKTKLAGDVMAFEAAWERLGLAGASHPAAESGLARSQEERPDGS